MAIRWEDEPGATNDVDELRKGFRERLYGPVTATPRPSIITYAQIEAVHEAMRELEDERETEAFTVEAFMAVDVDACFAKIRAALAGEQKGGSDGSP